MTGRKNPKMTENERDHAYRTWERRSYGERVVGDEAEGIADKGAVGEVRAQRRAWAREHGGEE